jgi:hypothetical protein
MKATTLLTPLVLLLTGLSCKETPPEPPKPATISLKAEDASCTEAWLKATTTETPATVRLLRDGQRTSDFRLLTSDSLLIDEGLLPRHTYAYQLQKLNADSSIAETSASVQLTTMDTTSHSFTWQIDTLGVTSSVLYDVAIINDTLAYAVGEIFHRDSSENWTFFNLAKWNGRQWTLHRVYYQGNNIVHTRWILTFNERDIWITSYMHWDGTRFHEVPFDPIFSGVRTNKAWGTSSSDFYVVGDGGFIAHYNGSPNGAGTWQRVESGTSVAIQDIWGVRNSLTRQQDILAAVCPGYGLAGTKLLSINENSRVDTIPWVSARGARSVWFDSSLRFHVCGDGVFRREPGSRWHEIAGSAVIPVRTERLRGMANNDLFVVGNYGAIAHFNGVNFRLYPEAASALVYTSLDFKRNQMIAVGYTSSRAIALRMWR